MPDTRWGSTPPRPNGFPNPPQVRCPTRYVRSAQRGPRSCVARRGRKASFIRLRQGCVGRGVQSSGRKWGPIFENVRPHPGPLPLEREKVADAQVCIERVESAPADERKSVKCAFVCIRPGIFGRPSKLKRKNSKLKMRTRARWRILPGRLSSGGILPGRRPALRAAGVVRALLGRPSLNSAKHP